MDIYRFYGIHAAMELLRPGANWEIYNNTFTRWDDPRPQPTWEEIQETIEKIKAFEVSINTIWLPGQHEQLQNQYSELLKISDASLNAFGNNS